MSDLLPSSFALRACPSCEEEVESDGEGDEKHSQELRQKTHRSAETSVANEEEQSSDNDSSIDDGMHQLELLRADAALAVLEARLSRLRQRPSGTRVSSTVIGQLLAEAARERLESTGGFPSSKRSVSSSRLSSVCSREEPQREQEAKGLADRHQRHAADRGDPGGEGDGGDNRDAGGDTRAAQGASTLSSQRARRHASVGESSCAAVSRAAPASLQGSLKSQDSRALKKSRDNGEEGCSTFSRSSSSPLLLKTHSVSRASSKSFSHSNGARSTSRSFSCSASCSASSNGLVDGSRGKEEAHQVKRAQEEQEEVSLNRREGQTNRTVEGEEAREAEGEEGEELAGAGSSLGRASEILIRLQEQQKLAEGLLREAEEAVKETRENEEGLRVSLSLAEDPEFFLFELERDAESAGETAAERGSESGKGTRGRRLTYGGTNPKEMTRRARALAFHRLHTHPPAAKVVGQARVKEREKDETARGRGECGVETDAGRQTVGEEEAGLAITGNRRERTDAEEAPRGSATLAGVMGHLQEEVRERATEKMTEITKQTQ
ncbi:UNVERIFIED_CONTAM: hypothetical protein HHA_461810 [Hammondia hammondi]|eukprot:XP_008889253.1 hypothetical protein HHA_461810 [Hammondia hammondi]